MRTALGSPLLVTIVGSSRKWAASMQLPLFPQQLASHEYRFHAQHATLCTCQQVKRTTGRRYATPAGKVVKGWIVQLEPTPEQAAQFRRDCGARRFAYNWAVTAISESFAAGKETGEYDNEVWSAYSLRKRWTQVKAEAAPWWAECSKESYVGGITAAR